MLWPAAKITLCAGKAAFWSSASEVFTPVIREESRPTTPPNSRRAFLIIRVAAHEMVPPIGARASWVRPWALVTIESIALGGASVCNPIDVRRYMASDDPQFEKKAADIIGLYLKPPANAAVFCVDEKSAIQALDRLDPVLPLSPGRAERHGFEYYRHGTLSLYGALETRTGEVVAKTAPRHTSAEFVAFLAQIVAQQPKGRKIHIIADNLSAHKTKGVAEFLAHHRQVKLHYTPTYSSWLNQVELWFSKIQRDLIARGVFTSVPDLSLKLLRYIAHYNKAPKAFKWSWRNPSQRISPTHLFSDTVH